MRTSRSVQKLRPSRGPVAATRRADGKPGMGVLPAEMVKQLITEALWFRLG